MRKMKAKRFLATVLSVCLAVLTLFSFTGCGKGSENYVYKDGDFRLTLVADKTNDVKVGESIRFEATLENVSGRDVVVESFSQTIEGIIDIYIFNNQTSDVEVPGGGSAERKQFRFTKDTSITKTEEYLVDGKLSVVECFAQVSFYIGDSVSNTTIKSEIMKLSIAK